MTRRGAAAQLRPAVENPRRNIRAVRPVRPPPSFTPHLCSFSPGVNTSLMCGGEELWGQGRADASEDGGGRRWTGQSNVWRKERDWKGVFFLFLAASQEKESESEASLLSSHFRSSMFLQSPLIRHRFIPLPFSGLHTSLLAPPRWCLARRNLGFSLAPQPF